MEKINGQYSFSSEEENKILDLYVKQIKSLSYIAKQFNVDSSVIKRLLIKYNIEIRNNNTYKKKKLNENYFHKIDSFDKAYWLGFIYADGYITNTTFGIKLKSTDIKHLHKLKNCLESEHKIGIGNNESETYGNCEYCYLCINNKQLVQDLLSQGVFYNKSKILKPPSIDSKFIPAFIRGYFDGDGSVYEYSKTHEGSISFVGTKELLEFILENLKTCCSTNTNIYKYKNKDIYEIKIGGSNNFSNIYKYLYSDDSMYLDRKKQKYENILAYRQTFNDYNNQSDCNTVKD